MCSNENDPLKPGDPTSWTAADEEIPRDGPCAPWTAEDEAVAVIDAERRDAEEELKRAVCNGLIVFDPLGYWDCDLPEEKVTMLETAKRVLKNKWVLVIVLGFAALLSGGAYSDQIKNLLLSILGG